MSITSARLTATGTAISYGNVQLDSVVLTAGSDTATATLYDATSATGTPICDLSATTGLSVPFLINRTLYTGLHVVITGTSPKFNAFY